MSYRFSKHYTVEEARALLPQVREWLQQIEAVRDRLAKIELRLSQLAEEGKDVGGETLNESLRLRADLLEVIQEFVSRGIQIKDVERGLIDFPALQNGKEIFLCWEKDEEDIQFWHDLDSGYPGRERL